MATARFKAPVEEGWKAGVDAGNTCSGKWEHSARQWP